jgi:hypothetical protein
MGLVFVGLLALWGLFMILKPDLLWKIEHTGAMDRNRPSDSYMNKIRTGGVICLGIAAFLAICYFRQ